MRSQNRSQNRSQTDLGSISLKRSQYEQALRSIVSIHFILCENLPKVILSPSSFDQSFIGLGSHKRAPIKQVRAYQKYLNRATEVQRFRSSKAFVSVRMNECPAAQLYLCVFS